MINSTKTSPKLTESTIEKIEKCLYVYGQTCEVKIERGEQVVVSISRKKMQGSKEPMQQTNTVQRELSKGNTP